MTPKSIDVHAHLGWSVLIAKGQSVDEYLGVMDRFGIEQAIVSHVAGGRQVAGLENTVAENDLLVAALRSHPERFPLGLASFEPRHAEKAVEEVERALDAGLHGIVYHAWFQGARVGPALYPAVEVVAARRGLCLVHSMMDAFARPNLIGQLAGAFPDALFIMGHPSFQSGQQAEAIAVARQRENVLLDLAFQDRPENVEELVRELGPERILFGTDAPFYEPANVLASITQARIDEAAKHAIIYANAKKLIATVRGRIRGRNG